MFVCCYVILRVIAMGNYAFRHDFSLQYIIHGSAILLGFQVFYVFQYQFWLLMCPAQTDQILLSH